MDLKKFATAIAILILLVLASVGWIVLFVQNPVILAKARWRYHQAIWEKRKIPDSWIIEIDNHFVEMSSRGEIIKVQ